MKINNKKIVFFALFIFSSYSFSNEKVLKALRSKTMGLEKLSEKESAHIYRFYKNCIKYKFVDFFDDRENKFLRKECLRQSQILTMIFRSIKYRCQKVSWRDQDTFEDFCNRNPIEKIFYQITESLAENNR